MADYNDNLNELYKAAKVTGVTKISMADFSNKMITSPGYRGLIYNGLKKAGVEGIGDNQSDFVSAILPKEKAVAQMALYNEGKAKKAASSAPKAKQTQQAAEVGQTMFGGGEETTALQQAQQQVQQIQQANKEQQQGQTREHLDNPQMQSLFGYKNMSNSRVVNDDSLWDEKGFKRPSGQPSIEEGERKAKENIGNVYESLVNGKGTRIDEKGRLRSNDPLAALQQERSERNAKAADATREEVKNTVGSVIADADKRWMGIYNTQMKYTQDPMAAIHVANQENDPEKVLEEVRSKVSENATKMIQSNMATYEKAAKEEGITTEEYISKYIMPEISAQVEQEFDNAQMSRYMPQNAGEFIVEGLQDSIFGTLANMAVTTQSQRQYQQRATEEAGEKYGMGARLARMGVGFAGDAPVFAGTGKLANTVISKVGLGSIEKTVGKTMADRYLNFVNANLSRAERFASRATTGMAHGAINMGAYEGINGVVQTLNNGDTSLAGLGAAFFHGIRHGAVTGVAMGGVGSLFGELGSRLGARPGLSRGENFIRATDKAAFQMLGLVGEGFSMHLGEQINSQIEGTGFNLTWEGTLENAIMAGVMKISSPSHYKSFKKNVASMFLAEPKDNPIRLSDDDKRELMKVTGSSSMEEVMTKIFPDGEKAEGNATNAQITEAQTRYLEIMNSLSWDAQNKISVALTGTACSARPRTGRFEADGNILYEYANDGTLLSTHEFKNTEEKNAYVYQKRLHQENVDFWGTYGKALLRDKDAVITAMTDIARQNGVQDEYVIKAMEKEPIRRTQGEREILRQIEEALHEMAFPKGEVHTEQSAIDGEKAAQQAEVTSDEPKTEVVNNTNVEVTQAMADFAEAMKDAVWKEDYEELKKQGMSDADIYNTLMEQYNEAELAPLADYVNAQAKQQGFMQGVANEIEQKKSEQTNLVTSGKVTINGVERTDGRVITLVDADGNIVRLLSGDFKLNEDGTIETEQPIIVSDDNGNPRPLNSVDGWKVAGSTDAGEYASYIRELLGQKATAVIDPNGEFAQPAPTEAPKETPKAETEVQRNESEGTTEAEATEERAGKSLSQEEAETAIADMEHRAEVAPEVELTIENWDKLFGEDGKVNTPLGEVKMGENQFAKLMRKGRNSKLGMVKPTLENPDFIIEDASDAIEGDTAERNSSYVFIKAFTKEDGSRFYYFTSVTVSKEGKEVVVSNQEKNRNKVLRLLTEGNVIWRTPKDATTSSAERQGLDYAQPLEAETATKGSGITPQVTSSEGKGTDKSANNQENSVKSSVSTENSIPLDENGKKNYVADGVRPVDAVNDIYNRGVFTTEQADAYVQSKIEEARKAYDKVNKDIAPKKGEDPDDYLARLQAHDAEVTAAKQVLDRWQAIYDEAHKFDAKEEEAEDAMKTDDIDMRGLEDDPRYFIATHMLKITPESFNEQVGLGAREKRAMPGFLAKKENGGVSIFEATDHIMQFLKDQGVTVDEDFVKNTIIDILTSGGPRSYIKNMREEFLANVSREEAYERAKMDKDYLDNYGMEYDEYKMYEQSVYERIADLYRGVDEKELDKARAEQYLREDEEMAAYEADVKEVEQELAKTKENGRKDTGTEGRDGVLSEAQSGNKGGHGETAESSRVEGVRDKVQDKDGSVSGAAPRSEGEVKAEAPKEEPKPEPEKPAAPETHKDRLHNDKLPFEERIKDTEPLKVEDVDGLSEDFNGFMKDQVKSAIEKLESGQPLTELEKLFYLNALKDVRDTDKRSAQDSTDADRAQLAQGDNASEHGGNGSEGVEATGLDREGGRETPEGQPSGENSEDDLHQSSGSGGDREVRGGEPADDGISGASMESEPSGNSGSDGRNVRQRKGEGISGTTPSKATRDDIKSGIEAKKKKLAEIAKRLKKTPKNTPPRLYDVMSALGAWIGKMGDSVDWKAVGEFAQTTLEIGADYFKLGVHDFKEWARRIKGDLAETLKDTFGWGDAEVDDFIREMWNSKYTIDGKTHTIGQWASIIGDEALRKEIHRSLDEKREQQKAAESIEVKVGDRDNIDDTLPYLLPEQRDDVYKAEMQFFDKKHQDRTHGFGKGMMFTNGTGTGKTYTGLGIVKRFVKQGKGRVLIVTPSQPKVADWVKDGQNLGLEVTPLENTKDAGNGVVCTTYANLRANEAVLRDTFDLIVYDESHKIMENKKGEETIGTAVHYQLSNKNKQHAVERVKMKYEPFRKEKELRQEADDTRNIQENAINKLRELGISLPKHPTNSAEIDKHIRAIEQEGENVEGNKEKLNYLHIVKNAFNRLGEIPREIEALKPEQEKLMPEIEKEAEEAVKRTKSVFLSATPFNTRESLKYAEGYLFSYPEEDKNTVGTYNHRSPEQAFLEQHFSAGYRWRYGRLEQHMENAEALAKQEVRFSDYLQDQLGTLSTRQIDNGYDYSRTFPTVTLDKAEAFNQALQDVFHDKTMQPLWEAFHDVFYDYNKQTALFETMKTALAAERIREHLARGRKVVVFHRRRTTKDELQNPFQQALTIAKVNSENMSAKDKQKVAEAIAAFHGKYGDLLKWEQGLDYRLPREQLADIFGEDKVAFFSGEETTKQKNQSIADFMKDNKGKDIIVIQEASGKEGISLHDQTGEHQRVQISLCLPQSPIAFIQSEGRIYRIGQKSNAVFEYPLLGLNLEINLWAHKFNNALGTTEYLAMGSKARNLSESIAKGIMENSGTIGYDDAGVGGKAYDGNVEAQTATGFDGAITDYFTNQKISAKRENREGVDYFPTPEPVGYKMVEWAGLTEGESALEPSAGHGAIARYVPKSNNLTMIEPSQSLMSKLVLNTPGSGRKYEGGTFEDYNVINKHDAIVMNPPYGAGGTTAVEHVAKGFKHLNEGGRLIAIIPDGPACDKKMQKWLESKDAESAVITGEIRLPSCTFGRAGTAVNTRIVMIDKVTREEVRNGMPTRKEVDLRSVTDVNELFEKMRDIDMPERTIDKEYLREKAAKNFRRKIADPDSANKFVVSFVEANQKFVRIDFKRGGTSLWIDVEEIQNDKDAALRNYRRLKDRYDTADADFRANRIFTMGRGSNKVEIREADIKRDIYQNAMEFVAKVAGTTVKELDTRNNELMERLRNGSKPSEQPQTEVKPQESRWDYSVVKHTQTGADLHIVKSKERMTDEEYRKELARAKELGGFYDRYSKGFRFETKENADKFMQQEGETRFSEDLNDSRIQQLKNGNTDGYNEETKVLVRDALQGRKRVRGEFADAERRTCSEVQLAAATIAADRGGVPQAGRKVSQIERGTKEEIERGIEDYAKANGAWFDEKEIEKNSRTGEVWAEGGENRVYLSKDGKTVTKVLEPYERNENSMYVALRNIKLFNELFPHSAITVKGFLRDGDGKMRIVTEQPFVKGEALTREEYEELGVADKVREYFKERGLEDVYGDALEFKNDKYYVRDIHYGNIILDKNGVPQIFDANVTLHKAYEKEVRKDGFGFEQEPERMSEGEATPQPEDKPTVRAHIDTVSKDLNTPCEVHNDASTIKNEKVRKAIESGRKVKGWWDKDGVHLYMPNIHSRHDAETTILHETVGHDGLRKLMNGKDGKSRNFQKFLDMVWADKKNTALHEFVKEYAPKNGWDLHEAVDEWLAREAEKPVTDENFGMWGRVKAMFNNALRALGFKSDMSLNDVRYAIWLSKRMKQKPNDPLMKARAAAFRWGMEHSNYKPEVKDGRYVDSEDGKDETRLAASLTPLHTACVQEYNRRLQEESFKLHEANTDNMDSLRELQELISGKDYYDIKDSENAYIAENHASSKSEAAWNKFKVQLYQPLEAAINECVGLFGGNPTETIGKMEDYGMKKHGLERNRKLFVRDAIEAITDANAKQQMTLDWDNERHRLSGELRSGKIDYRKYLEGLDNFIRKNINSSYDPNKNDYSGISAYDPNRIKRGRKVEYDENAIIDDVMDMETLLGDKAQNFWDAVKQATDFAVDYSYETGMIDSKSQDHIKDMFDFYLPLRGFNEETMEDVYDYIGGRGNGADLPIRNAKGRLSEAESPLAHIAKMAMTSITRGEDNKVRQMFYRLVANHPSDAAKVSDVWEVKTKDPVTGNETWEVTLPDIPTDATPREIADIMDNFEALMEAKKGSGEARKATSRPNYGRVFENKAHASQHIVRTSINGKPKMVYVLGNPRAAQALNGQIVHKGAKNIVTKAMKWIASFSTSYSPEFILSNTSRDTLFANANIASKENAAYWWKFKTNQLISGARLSLTGIGGDRLRGESLFEKYYRGHINTSDPTEKLFAEFMDNGGRTGFLAMQDVDKLGEDLKASIKGKRASDKFKQYLKMGIGLIPKSVEQMNMRAELINRFATYMTSRQMGRSILRSVADAKEVSVNFNRKGAGNAGQGVYANIGYLRDYYMFYNAGIQSYETLWRNLKKDTSTAIRTTAFMGLIPGALGAAYAMWLAGMDDEEYSNIPSWDRRNNICIPVKGEGYVKIPLPIELRAFWGMGDIYASLKHKRLQTEESPTFAMLGQITQALPIDVLEAGEKNLADVKGYTWIVPTAARPLAEYAMNIDWKGAPIEKESKFNPDAPRWTRAYDSTNQILVKFCKYAHNTFREGKHTAQETDTTGDGFWIDPSLYDHLLKSYFGGAYSIFGKTLNTGINAVENGEIDFAHAPMTSRVWGGFSEREADATTNAKFWAYKREADNVGKEFSNAENKTNPMAITELKESSRGKRYAIFKSTDKEMQRLRKTISTSKNPDKVAEAERKQKELRRDLVDALDNVE